LNGSLPYNRFLLATATAAAVLFTGITLLVLNDITTPAEIRIVNAAETWETPLRNSIMLFITFLGNYQFLVPANLLLILFFIVRKKKNLARLVFFIAITGLGLKLALKALFARPRPDNPIIEGINNFGYPSGHALMGVAFYGLILLLYTEIFSTIFWRRVLCVICILLILLIGFSRLYLRVHYPTDVLAGYCLGISWVCLPVYFFTRRYQNLGLKANR
jgi:undecaprenyl-diphosphatase